MDGYKLLYIWLIGLTGRSRMWMPKTHPYNYAFATIDDGRVVAGFWTVVWENHLWRE